MDAEVREKMTTAPARRLARWLWQLFRSIRLALFLMLIIAGLSLIGVLIIQAPAGVTADPGLYGLWLENVAKPRLGVWANVLSVLRLFDVFHSPWFLGAGVLLIANIVVCALNRWKAMCSALVGGFRRQPDGFYLSGADRLELSSNKPSSLTASTISSALKKSLPGASEADQGKVLPGGG